MSKTKRPSQETIDALRQYYRSRLNILCRQEDWELDISLRGHNLTDKQINLIKQHVRNKRRH